MVTSKVEVHGKRIAFVSNSAWSVYNFRLDVILAMIEAGHSVIVFAPEDDFSAALTDSGCQFVPISFNNKTINPFNDLSFYRQLKKLYKQYRPDFIFHYVAKPNIYGSLAAAACNIPSVAVVTGLGYPFAKRNWLFYLLKNLYRLALRKSKEVWFLNNDDAKVFTNENIAGIEKMKVLPGEGVNTTHFSPMPVPKNRIYTFIMSTRLLKSKGIMIYADAARILRRKNYDVRFELIGFTEDHHPDSIQKSDLEKWQREGLITYLGFARDVRPFLARAHCFVFPSFYNEGVPRCLMEAAAMELPLITSATKGCRDVVVNNETGFICKTKDALDLADKMEKMLLLDDQEQRRMGRSGRAYVARKFSVEKIVEEYFTTLYNDLTD